MCLKVSFLVPGNIKWDPTQWTKHSENPLIVILVEVLRSIKANSYPEYVSVRTKWSLYWDGKNLTQVILPMSDCIVS